MRKESPLPLVIWKRTRNSKLRGTALLSEKGKYVDSLRTQENVLLMILQKQAKKEIPLTLQLPQMKKGGGGGIFDTNVISFNLDNLKNKNKDGIP